jgi:Phosphotransferase enzyme family
VLKTIVSGFLPDIDPNSAVFERIKIGHINETYKICLPSDKVDGEAYFILQKVNTAVFSKPEQVMDNIELVAAHLEHREYPKEILKPLRTKYGTYLYGAKNKDKILEYWRMYPFISNTHSVNQADTKEQAFAAAAAFGEYLGCLSSLKSETIYTTIPQFHDASLRLKQLKEALTNNSNKVRIEICRPQIGEVCSHLGFLKNTINLPQRICHHDTKINNVLFDNDTEEIRCIVDLDTLMPGTILSDFGDMVRTYTSEADENETDLSKVSMRLAYFKAIAEGFLFHLNKIITPQEKSNLVFGAKRIVLIQAIRFLTDYLNGNIYYQVGYDTQNLDRVKNQLVLLSSIISQETEMEQIISSIV